MVMLVGSLVMCGCAPHESARSECKAGKHSLMVPSDDGSVEFDVSLLGATHTCCDAFRRDTAVSVGAMSDCQMQSLTMKVAHGSFDCHAETATRCSFNTKVGNPTVIVSNLESHCCSMFDVNAAVAPDPSCSLAVAKMLSSEGGYCQLTSFDTTDSQVRANIPRAHWDPVPEAPTYARVRSQLEIDVQNAGTPQKIYELLVEKQQQQDAGSLLGAPLDELPVQLRGTNLTLDNVHKWFTPKPVLSNDDSEPEEETVSMAYTPWDSLLWSGDDMPQWVGISNTVKNSSSDGSLSVNPIILVNAAMKTWDFVKDNLPSVSIANGQYAAATPKGVSWTDIVFSNEVHMWGTKARPFRQRWINHLDVQCAIVKWGLRRYIYGHYGTGKRYMKQITQQVYYVDAGWGWSVEARSEISDPVNVQGTATNPRPAMTFDLDVSANGYHRFDHRTVRGDGSGSTPGVSVRRRTSERRHTLEHQLV